MVKIVAISDIHGKLDNFKNIKQELNNYDYRVFLGDFCSNESDLLNNFEIKIKGNNDIFDDDLLKNSLVTIGGYNIFFCHGDEHLGFLNKGYNKIVKFCKNNKIDIFVFGHTHIRTLEKIDGIYLFNPGSISYPRDFKKPAYGTITIDEINRKLDFQWIEISN